MRKKYMQVDRQKVERLLGQGVSCANIAERLGTSQQNILRIAREIRADVEERDEVDDDE